MRGSKIKQIRAYANELYMEQKLHAVGTKTLPREDIFKQLLKAYKKGQSMEKFKKSLRFRHEAETIESSRRKQSSKQKSLRESMGLRSKEV